MLARQVPAPLAVSFCEAKLLCIWEKSEVRTHQETSAEKAQGGVAINAGLEGREQKPLKLHDFSYVHGHWMMAVSGFVWLYS